MARKQLRLATAVPKTKKAMKHVYRRTTKRVRFLLKDTRTRVKKMPSYLDRMMSRVIRSVTRKR